MIRKLCRQTKPIKINDLDSITKLIRCDLIVLMPEPFFLYN